MSEFRMGQAYARVRTHLVRFFLQLDIELIERLNMIARERDRHNHGILVTLFGPPLDGIAGLGAQPRARSDLALPRQTVRVAPT